MQDVISKTQHVKSFFDNTHLYLRKSFGVSLRAYVVRSLLGELEHSRILDLGCGDGSVSLQYLSRSNHLKLVDLSDKMLERARLNTPDSLKNHIEYINQDFHQLEWQDYFDIILCIGVLAHVPSLEETISTVTKFLKPGGLCIFQLTDAGKTVAKIEGVYRSRQSKNAGYGYAVNKTTPAQIIKLAADCGLKLVGQRRFSLLLPGMGKLPDKWLYGYQMLTLRNRFLSRFGSEVILLFSKG